MGAWFFARLGRAALAAWVIASAVFLLSRQSTADPEQRVLDQIDQLGRASSPAALAASRQVVRHRLGLDIPVFYVTRAVGGQWQWRGTPNQYHTWLGQLLRGHLGQSYRDGQPVTALLGPALAYTLPLISLALVLGTGLALGLATYLAAGPAATPGRAALLLLLTSLQALPLFVLGLLLLLLLANPAVINILPATDLADYLPDPGNPRWLAAYAVHLLLPTICLVLASLPELTLPLAAALRHELASPYAITALAKGFTIKSVLWRHTLPNAVLPLLSSLAGLLPALAAGVVVVEVLFALPGMGRLLADAATTHDYPVLVAGVLLAAAARLLALLLADAAHYWLDPRLRAASA